MPKTLKRNKCPFTAEQRVRAWQSFATEAGTIRAGDVLRGDDPVVLEHWRWFESVDTPTAEAKNFWSELPAPPDHREPGIEIGTSSLAHVPAERLVRAVSAFWFDQGWSPGSPGEKSGRPSGFGWGIQIGQLFEISNPVVKANPSAFVWPERPVTLADVERITSEIERDGKEAA